MTIANTQVRNSILALAAVLLVAISFTIVPKAQAADLTDGWIPVGYSNITAPSYDALSAGSDWIPVGYSDVVSPVYDYSVTDYWSYPVSSFGGGYGGWSYPVSSFGGTGGTYVSQNQAQSQSQTSTNVNNNVNNINVSVPTQTVAQVQFCPQGMTGTYPNCVWPVQPVQPQYDVCINLPGIQTIVPAGYYVQNGNCYQNYVQPVYPTQPYVTLSAVPYTGLELGTTGTIIYWGFLVAWCLLAAYLIAVKKVHNKIAAWFMGSEQVETKVAYVAPAAAATTASAEFSGIDPFIASQIRR